MHLIQASSSLNEYLASSSIIDFDDDAIKLAANRLSAGTKAK